MFDFIVFFPGTMFGRPELHAILECDGVSYCVMFGLNGEVYCGAGNL